MNASSVLELIARSSTSTLRVPREGRGGGRGERTRTTAPMESRRYSSRSRTENCTRAPKNPR